jgi:hypothetical protein
MLKLDSYVYLFEVISMLVFSKSELVTETDEALLPVRRFLFITTLHAHPKEMADDDNKSLSNVMFC